MKLETQTAECKKSLALRLNPNKTGCFVFIVSALKVLSVEPGKIKKGESKGVLQKKCEGLA